MPMVTVEAIVLIPQSFVWVTLQPIGPHQGGVIPNLYQDLIERSVKRSEVGHSPWQGP